MTGKIGAIKGLGGYHLACVARHASQPWPSCAAASTAMRSRSPSWSPTCRGRTVSARSRPPRQALLQSPRRPIVLLRRKPVAGRRRQVARAIPFLGVMLPYTPLHHLLLHELDGCPLVMTSGNRSDEPIAYEDDDALERLARHRRLVPDPRPADPCPLRRFGDAGRRRRRAADPPLARLRPAARSRCRSRCPRADPAPSAAR